MSIGGISGGGGHIGAAESTRRANTLSSIGSTAFNTLVSAGSVAAGAFGGPAAASAVSSMRGLAGGASGGTDIDSQVANISEDITNNTNGALGAEGQRSQEDFSRQLALFSLQRSVNSQSQTANMIANMQKARHDAMMATIQNTR